VQLWLEEKGDFGGRVAIELLVLKQSFAGFEAELPRKVPSKIQFWTER
jgi:hypothetical protein